MKQELAYVPFLGWSLQGATHLFLTRKWAEDQRHIHSLVEYWKQHDDNGKTSVLIFPEGTNIGKHSIPKAREYCAKMGMDNFQYVLPPRSTGTCELLLLLSGQNKSIVGDYLLLSDTINLEDASIDAVYDMTVSYATTYQNLYMAPLKGYFPSSVHVHCKRYPIKEIIAKLANDASNIAQSTHDQSSTTSSGITRAQTTVNVRKILRTHFDSAVSNWLVELFRKKDEKLEKFYTSPRIDDQNAPPMLDDHLILPCETNRDSRRIEPRYKLLNNDFAFEVKCVAITLIIGSLFYHALFTGNTYVWIYFSIFTVLSIVVLNVLKWRIDIATLNVCKDTTHNN